MKEVIQHLANLQYIDSRIDELTRLRGDLPEEILDLEHEVERVQSRIARLEAQEIELTRERTTLRADIEDSVKLVAKYEHQQLTVRNNREYDALTKEIESQKQLTENAKSRLEEIALILEEGTKNLADYRIQDEELSRGLTAKKENLEELIERTKSEEAMLRGKREEAKSLVEPRYLKSYERLRNGLTNGIAVVAMEKGSCLGMMLPPQVQMEVRKMSKIIIDDNSGRIVIDPEFFVNAKQTFTF
jgi:predicted  nucleic acid-binding Zn-ribbon protein